MFLNWFKYLREQLNQLKNGVKKMKEYYKALDEWLSSVNGVTHGMDDRGSQYMSYQMYKEKYQALIARLSDVDFLTLCIAKRRARYFNAQLQAEQAALNAEEIRRGLIN